MSIDIPTEVPLPEPDATNPDHLRFAAHIVDQVAPNDSMDSICLRAHAEHLEAERSAEREREQRIEQFISILADCGVVAQTSSGLDNLRQAGERLMSAGLLRGGGRDE